MTTGKNKEQIINWLWDNRNLWSGLSPNEFFNKPLTEQIGVYLAYYDSLGLPVSIEYFALEFPEKWYYKIGEAESYRDAPYDTRKEAQEAFLIEANDIINNQ